MAELNTGEGKKEGGKVRSKKSNAGVDLTAMVDLAFLLITFFMLTTTLSKPQSMDLAMPDKDKEKDPSTMDVPDDRTLTILLGKDNTVQWYMGQFDNPLVPFTKTTYGKDGIRKELLVRVKSTLASTGDPSKGLIVIIKPSDKTNYRNLVDILDEMVITKVQLYAIGDITPAELELLERDGMY